MYLDHSCLRFSYDICTNLVQITDMLFFHSIVEFWRLYLRVVLKISQCVFCAVKQRILQFHTNATLIFFAIVFSILLLVWDCCSQQFSPVSQMASFDNFWKG